VGLVAGGLLIYFLIRGNVVDRATVAARNALDLIRLEQSLGIFWEPAMQRWVLESSFQVRLWNWVYFWLHAPTIVLVGLWLLLWHERQYVLMRNAFLASAVLGLLCYSLYPVAPPRLMEGLGFVDTMREYSTVSYQAESLRPFVNPYAALPSLHFGWAFLCAVGIWLARRDSWSVLVGILLTASMGIAIIFTANHYIVDGVAGWIVCTTGLGGALWWDRGRPLPWRRAALRHHHGAGAPGTI